MRRTTAEASHRYGSAWKSHFCAAQAAARTAARRERFSQSWSFCLARRRSSLWGTQGKSSRRYLFILGIFTLLSVAKALRSGRRSNCKSRYHFRTFFALRSVWGTGGIAGMGKPFGAFCALSGGGIYSISGFENKLYLFRALYCISRADSV